MQLVILHICTIVQNPNLSGSWEISDRNLIREKEKMNEKKKRYAGGGWNSFTRYNCSYPTFVPNFKIVAIVVSEKSATEI